MSKSRSRGSQVSEQTLAFFQQVTGPRRDRLGRGETIGSLVAGGMSIVLAGFCLASFFGYTFRSLPGMVHRATIVVSESSGLGFQPKLKPGWWYVPELNFWNLVTVGLLLGVVGIAITRRRRLSKISVAGFALNLIALVVGYVLAFTDYQSL